jgi:5'-nucleotidase / UDP-sugar diphosphatase
VSRLVIYHTSDIHAAAAFGDRLAALVEPGSLLVDSGDALAGSSVFYRSSEPVADELAKAPYAAMAVGNREFHYLHGAFLARARRLHMPLVCTNLIDLRGRPPVFARVLRVRVNDMTLRILALLVPQYRTGSGWERFFGWRFLAPEAALAEFLDHGASSGEPTIILSHLGLGPDRAIAQHWPKIAAILGGHTHATLHQPEIVSGVPIAHPGAYAHNVGRLELEIAGAASRFVSYQLLPLRSVH